MIIALLIFSFSTLGIIALLLRHVPQLSEMTEEEVVGVLQRERPLLTQLWESIFRTFQAIWYRYFREKTFSFIVKKVSRLRILTLRMEQALFRFTARIRTRTRSPRAPSAYWKDMHDWRKTVHWHKNKEE